MVKITQKTLDEAETSHFFPAKPDDRVSSSNPRICLQQKSIKFSERR